MGLKMDNKISKINDFIAKTDYSTRNTNKIQKNSDSFSGILQKIVSSDKTLSSEKTGSTSSVFGTPGINPLNRLEFNKEAASHVEKNIDDILSLMEIFAGLLGNKDIDPEDIKPFAGSIKEDTDNLLRYSERNNIPEELKSIARQSSAIAYAALKKFDQWV